MRRAHNTRYCMQLRCYAISRDALLKPISFRLGNGEILFASMRLSRLKLFFIYENKREYNRCLCVASSCLFRFCKDTFDISRLPARSMVIRGRWCNKVALKTATAFLANCILPNWKVSVDNCIGIFGKMHLHFWWTAFSVKCNKIFGKLQL